MQTIKHHFKFILLGFVSFVIVLIGATSLLVHSISSRVFVVVTPVEYQTFQRDWKNNNASIPIEVDGVGFGDSFSLQVKWLNDSWIPVRVTKIQQPCAETLKLVSAAPDGSSCSRYQGSLPDRPAGQSTLSVRLDDWWSLLWSANSEVSVEHVGIGDVFLLAGQSNSVGVADNFQEYQSTRYIATMFSRTGNWMEMDDNVLTDQRSLDITATDIKGSPWPLLGTLIMHYTNVPVAFIPTGLGGQPISLWAANGVLYQFMVNQTRHSGIQPVMILWIQGETEGIEGMLFDEYRNDLVKRVYADLHLRMMIADLGELTRSDVNNANVAQIRHAIESVWADNPLVYRGPSLADIPLTDHRHFRTDAEVKQFAQRWFDSLLAVGLPAQQ